MCLVSDWYTSLAEYTFPTIFIRLRTAEIEALVTGERNGDTAKSVIKRMQRAIKVIPGSSFLHADYCAPTDSPVFQRAKGAIGSGRKGWEILCESDKVRQAFADGRTQRICLHPYRRMDPVREFRVFVKGREIAAMSQLRLDRHQPKLEGRKGHIWRKAKTLIDDIADYLPRDDIAVDIYLTSAGAYMIIDMNPWGEPTDPLLFRTWERDWDQKTGLLLVPKPTKLGGEVEVSP